MANDMEQGGGAQTPPLYPGTRFFAPNNSTDPRIMNNTVHIEQDGRPYIQRQDGGKYYVPSMQGQRANQGGFFADQQFNVNTGQYERHINWGNIIGLGTAGVIGGFGAAAAAGGLGGAAASTPYAAGAGPGLAEGAGIAGVGVDATVPGIVGGAAAGGSAAGESALEASPYFAQGTGPGLVAGDGINAGAGSGVMSRVGDLGRVINGINTQRQQGREAEARATTDYDRNANVRYANSIAAAKVNLGAGQERGAQSVQGDILANAKPFQWTGDTKMVGNTPVPQYTGGLTPDIYSKNTRDLGGLLSQQALQQQQTNGGQAVGPQDPLTPLPKAGKGDSILGALGTLASMYGAYRGVR